VVKTRTLDVGGCAIGDGVDIAGQDIGITPLNSLIALPRSFGDNAGHRLACSLSEPMRFRVYNVQTHGLSTFVYKLLPFLLTSFHIKQYRPQLFGKRASIGSVEIR